MTPQVTLLRPQTLTRRRRLVAANLMLHSLSTTSAPWRPQVCLILRTYLCNDECLLSRGTAMFPAARAYVKPTLGSTTSLRTSPPVSLPPIKLSLHLGLHAHRHRERERRSLRCTRSIRSGAIGTWSGIAISTTKMKKTAAIRIASSPPPILRRLA